MKLFTIHTHFIRLTIVVWLIAPLGLRAQLDDGNLQGKIGAYPIYLHIEEWIRDSSELPRLNVTYYYQSAMKDIALEGERNGNHYTFSREGERFDLKEDGHGGLTGHWYDENDKSLTVNLKPLDVSTVKHPYEKLEMISELKETDPYNYVRTSFIVFERDTITAFNGKSFVWISEKHADVDFFRLGNGFDAATLQRINPILDEMQIQMLIDLYNCTGGWTYMYRGNGIDYTVTVNYLDENLLGFNIFSSWDCGGAHPDFGGEGYLIDLHSGKKYDLDEIIAFDESAVLNSENGDAWSTYRTAYFAPKIVQLLDSIYEFDSVNDESDCDYQNEEYWDFVSWSFTEEGIEFTPYFFRAARACEEPFLIPFSVLRRFKSKRFPYEFSE